MGSGSLPVTVESEGGICIVYVYSCVYIYIYTYSLYAWFYVFATYHLHLKDFLVRATLRLRTYFSSAGMCNQIIAAKPACHSAKDYAFKHHQTPLFACFHRSGLESKNMMFLFYLQSTLELQILVFLLLLFSSNTVLGFENKPVLMAACEHSLRAE